MFLFVVDTCLPESELESLKDSIQQTLNLLPEDALVGLITFGAHVLVHEIGFGECHKAIAFKGSKDYSAQRVQELLNIAPGNRPQQQQQQQGGRAAAIGSFLMTVGDCSFYGRIMLEDLGRDHGRPRRTNRQRVYRGGASCGGWVARSRSAETG